MTDEAETEEVEELAEQPKPITIQLTAAVVVLSE